ncbi:MAG: tail fiber domain-containing protein [Agathobacter sp.]|nr:tail fiber domain-containing protein [Agathobacter sp.]
MRDYKYGDFYFDSQHDKQMKIDVVGTGIVIDNSMIEMEAFELDEALCSESELKFGCCEANCVKFTARNLPSSIKGNEINITETIDGNTDEPFPYGKYKVQSDVPTSDRTKREITAYDAMYDIINADMKSWYAGLPFPMTLRQFRDSFFAYFGIKQKETTLVNDGMTVNKTLTATQTDSESTITEESSISGKTVIEAICEINGVFGNINHDGEFEYVELEPIIQPLYPSNDLYPREDLFPRDPNSVSLTGHYITFDYEDFRSKAITQLEIRPSDDSAGVIVGTSGNNYVISGNFLVSDKTGAELEAIAENTLSVIKKAAYIPIKSSEIVGNPCIELGDPIRFNTTREIVESYVLQRTLTGIQSKRDSITASGTETHSQNPNGIKGQIESVARRTNKLERTADHTLSELADLDASTSSRFEQTAEQIQTEVSNRQNADNEMLTKVSQTAHSIALVASGGDNSVGITIQLYDENGNLIDTDSGNANINIVGFVTFSDLAGNGTTTINGNNIKTGTISCDLLSGGTINGQEFRQVSDYGELIISNGIIRVPRAGAILIGNNEAATQLWVQESAVAHAARNAYDADYADYAASAGSASSATNATNATYLKNGVYVYVSSNGNFIPSSSSIACGTKTYPFRTGWTVDGWETTSDERLKKDFVSLKDDQRFEAMFYLLDPMEYKFQNDENGKVHVGFSAQKVKTAMDSAGIEENEFFGYIHEYSDRSDFDSEEAYEEFLVRNNGNSDCYGLSYQEFMGLILEMILLMLRHI